MKKLSLTFGILASIYAAGFFLLLPFSMYMVEIEAGYQWVTKSYRLNDTLYQDWVIKFDSDNMVKIVWEKQGTSWCENFDKCSTGNEHNKNT
jgi:hypothetical protein